MFSLARKALVQVIMPVRAPFYVFLSAVVLRRCWSGSPPTQHRNGGHIMFNRKSSYALNKKDPNAIVYMDANEAIIRLTREDFASEEEFLKWKSLSDADYHASEKEDHVYANHTLALDELSEEAASIPAADVCMEQAHDRVAEIRRSTQKVTQIRKHLTDTQFRRMWMYFVDGMTIDEIGKVEDVSHQAISLNITAAIRKIKKYF
jgi:DNA-directed RNA polymerase specialized sigma subunit